MDNLSSELNKLKIDKSKRTDVAAGSRGGGWKLLAILLLLAVLGFAGTRLYQGANAAIQVETVHPRVENASQSAVLVATGYVVAHHKIQVGSKIMGRVAWIGVEKGDRVKKDQVVAR